MFRAAARTTNLARTSLRQSLFSAKQVRNYSVRHNAQQASSNMGLYLSLGGLAGIATWYGMGGFNGDIRSKLQKINADSEDVALSNEEFRALKLKEIGRAHV